MGRRVAVPLALCALLCGASVPAADAGRAPRACATAAKRAHGARRCARRVRAAFVATRGRVARLAGAPAVAVADADANAVAAGGDEATAAAPAAAPSAGEPAPAPAPVLTSTLGVEARDVGGFILRLTKTSAPAGRLTIYFRNYDASEHNLWLEPPAPAIGAVQISANVGRDGGATKTVSVTPGGWRLYCSILGHESMSRTLTVTGG